MSEFFREAVFMKEVIELKVLFHYKRQEDTSVFGYFHCFIGAATPLIVLNSKSFFVTA